MSMNNPFDDPAFSMASLTDSINILPNMYGRAGELGLFRNKPVRTRSITIEENNGVLNLLPTQAPETPGSVGVRGKRKLRSFNIPHIPHDDVVLPEEVQGKGTILDADGSELVNLYDEFEITAKTINFALGTESTNVKKKCLEVKRHIEKSLRGEVMRTIHALVSPEFFDALTGHTSVKEAFERWQEGRALRDDMRDGFTFGGITFEEYNAEAGDVDGNVRRFIAEGEGHAFPMGTLNTFRTYFAPTDFNETVNTLGREIYAKQESRKFERGTDLHTQSNPLPLCLRPAVLVKIKAS